MSREVIDAGTVAIAASTPVWVQHVEQMLQPFMVIGAATLVALRILVALKELLKKDKEKAHG